MQDTSFLEDDALVKGEYGESHAREQMFEELQWSLDDSACVSGMSPTRKKRLTL